MLGLNCLDLLRSIGTARQEYGVADSTPVQVGNVRFRRGTHVEVVVPYGATPIRCALSLRKTSCSGANCRSLQKRTSIYRRLGGHSEGLRRIISHADPHSTEGVSRT